MRLLIHLGLAFVSISSPFSSKSGDHSQSITSPPPVAPGYHQVSAKWQDIAHKPLAQISSHFNIGGQRLNLYDDPQKVLGYYRTNSSFPYTERWLRKHVYLDRNAHAGRALIERGILGYGNYQPIQLSISTLRWNENPFSNLNWQWYHHQLISIHFLIALAREANTRAPMQLAQEIVSSWTAANYCPSPPSPLSWNDHSTAYRLRTLLCLFERLRTLPNAEAGFMADLLRLIDSHCRVLADPRFFARHTNHGFDQAVILFWAASAFPELVGSDQWLRLGQDRIRNEIGFMFTPEGVHVENTPTYHVWMLGALEEFMIMSDQSRRADLEWILNDGWEYAAYALQPTGRFPLVGDAEAIDFSTVRSGRSYPGCHYFTYSATRGAMGTRPIRTDAVYPHSGYAVFRDAWHEGAMFKDTIYFFFKCGFLSNYHRQDDDLNFVLSAFGQEWIIDSGLFGYEVDSPIRRYMVSAWAHNTIVVEGAEVIRQFDKLPPPGSAIIEYGTEKERSFVTGRSVMQRGYAIERRIEYYRPRRFVLRDTVSPIVPDAPAYPNYTVLFHTPQDKRVNVNSNNRVVVFGEAGSQLELNVEPAPKRIRVVSGQGEDRGSECSWVSERMTQVAPSQCIRLEFEGVTSSTYVLTLEPASERGVKKQ